MIHQDKKYISKDSYNFHDYSVDKGMSTKSFVYPNNSSDCLEYGMTTAIIALIIGEN